jgi:hypothetical protein
VKNVLNPMGFDLDRTTQSKTLNTFFEFWSEIMNVFYLTFLNNNV